MSALHQRRLTAIILIPMLFGFALLAIAEIDLRQYRNGGVRVDTLLMREIPIVLLGLLTSPMNLIGSLVLLARRQWSLAGLAILSAASFFICFQIGGEMGAAYLNAT